MKEQIARNNMDRNINAELQYEIHEQRLKSQVPLSADPVREADNGKDEDMAEAAQ